MTMHYIDPISFIMPKLAHYFNFSYFLMTKRISKRLISYLKCA